MPGILILCTGNSARTQMAEGLLRHECGARWEVHSAGTHPTVVRPEAVEVMNELGIDIAGHWSKSVDEFRDTEFDFVITVCDNANAACPVFPGGTKRLHWPFEDPAAVTGTFAAKLDAFRQVRDQIRAKVREFVAHHSS